MQQPATRIDTLDDVARGLLDKRGEWPQVFA